MAILIQHNCTCPIFCAAGAIRWPTQLTCSYRLVILPIPRHFAPNPRPHVLNSLHLSLLVSGNCSVSRDIHVCLAMRRMAEPILLSLSAPALKRPASPSELLFQAPPRAAAVPTRRSPRSDPPKLSQSGSATLD
ncbi:hypothetical protein H9L39_06697 [Fusarium oxysporum f. sp. albedinis]|nr:hypothetical protein H9L39_06697 [Fusarium oxysporum f. sp. albedinis]